jgi:hypothetical protein
MKTNIYCLLYLAHFFLVWDVSEKHCRENQNTHFVFYFFFFEKSYYLKDNVEKYCRAGQATYDNMAHTHCMLDTQGYKYTQVVQHLLLFHRINGYRNAPRCYIIRTLPVLLSILVTTWNLFGDVCCEVAVLCFDCYSIWPHPYSRISANLDDVHRVCTKQITMILIWHLEYLLKPVNSRTYDINMNQYFTEHPKCILDAMVQFNTLEYLYGCFIRKLWNKMARNFVRTDETNAIFCHVIFCNWQCFL